MDDGRGKVRAGGGELEEIAGMLGLRSSDVDTVLRAVQGLEDKIGDSAPLETLRMRTEMLNKLAEQLERAAGTEEEKEDVRAPAEKKSKRSECSWDGDEVLELSVMLAEEDEEDDRDEYTHRKVCSLAETSKQLEVKQKELLDRISVRESDIKAVLPIINALSPPPETATSEQRQQLEHEEDVKLTSLLEQAVSDANELLRDATEELQAAVAHL